ncbi:MAG TPA: prolyl oligopeptidase family serine peptidase [Burkholderiaceae bacterium]|nr:prolyl oligopeptidase family serine peptidase [Burkholderiaceae bacterium]
MAVEVKPLPTPIKVPTANPCPDADGVRKVDGKFECLVIQTTLAKAGTTAEKKKQISPTKQPDKPSTTLLIYLHGDSSRGGLYDRHFKHFTTLADQNTVFVGMIRPGYADSFKNASTGSTMGGGDNYTAHNVDAVANAIQALKTKYTARRVVLVGYSGGAATAGVILGRHPELLDDAVLIACPCDLNVRRQGWAQKTIRRSLSPHEVADKVFKTAHVTAITGAKDNNTKPEQVTGYIQTLQTRGVKARYIEVPNATHETGILGTAQLRQLVLSHLQRK